MYSFDRKEYERRIGWFTDARFGMFIHFGLYSIPARGEWLRSDERVEAEDYEPYIEEFTAEGFDAGHIVRLAKAAGMKYAVLTTKHHDGFCLFDSAHTDFTSMKAPCHRDLTREFVEACRQEGIRVGLYYSLIDWHHPDYPHMGDELHPMRGRKDHADEGRCWSRYLEYMHAQVRELMTAYGRIDMLFLDYSYGDMRGEKWDAAHLVDMVRTLQPGIVINNRLEVGGTGYGSLVTDSPLPWHGDYVTPEQIIPPDGIRDSAGRPVAWESCVTMNRHWGYHAQDLFYKSPRALVRKLVECASKGGNMILNISPDGHGRIPKEQEDTLREIGRWMESNGASIYGCTMAGLPKPEYGRFTKRGDRLYFHILDDALGAVPIQGIDRRRIAGIRDLAHGNVVPVATHFTYADYPDVVFADLGPDPRAVDGIDHVLEIRLKDDI